MPRPKLCLCDEIKFNPDVKYFKPRGVSMNVLKFVELTTEELEAMRLKNSLGLDQIECAKRMKTSQSTLQRILISAYQKIADALTNGKAIKIIAHQQARER